MKSLFKDMTILHKYLRKCECTEKVLCLAYYMKLTHQFI